MDYIKNTYSADRCICVDEQIAEFLAQLQGIQHDALVADDFEGRRYADGQINNLLANCNLKSVSTILKQNSDRLQKEWGNGIGKGQALMSAKSGVSNALDTVNNYIKKTNESEHTK